ncbi:MAG: hypothetical protein KGL93_11690, partial [Gemmatimonadota bacterium]|nr:hypothetical protein [Gemmatimonadota bacterium]
AGAPGGPPAPAHAPDASADRAAIAADTSSQGLIPAGYGTLRQEDVSIKLSLEGVLVQLLPMNESVIRTLSPDAYRTLHELLAGYRSTIRAYAAQYGLRDDNVWYVSFYGMAPDATFSPLDLTIRAPGRDFTPLRVIPITPGFGQNRLQVRDVQRAFYLFDDGLPLNQPLTVVMGAVTDDSWQTIERKIEAEQAHVRARAARAPDERGGGSALRRHDYITLNIMERP